MDSAPVRATRYAFQKEVAGVRSRPITESELPHSHIWDLVGFFFISLSGNCNSYYVLNTCYVLLAFHLFFLTCITACWHYYPQFPEAEPEVSEGKDLRKALCRARESLTPQPSPPQLPRREGGHGALAAMRLSLFAEDSG